MPGTPSSYLNTGTNALNNMLGLPIPGVDSPGFDQLSENYQGEEEQGISDIASRGLTTTGATPTMFQGLNQQYNQGAAQVNAAGTAAQQQQRLQILNTLLGLGGAASNLTRANALSTEEDVGAGGNILEGLFGTSPGGLLSTGLGTNQGVGGGKGGLLSQILNL